MKISDLFVMGIRSLFRRKVRTILTVLGVVIGCLFIIITISIGHGMDESFETQVKEIGSVTKITIREYGDIFDGDGNWAGSQQQELDKDLVELIKTIDHVRAVTPIIYANVRLFSGKYEAYPSLIAMNKEVFSQFDFPDLEYGEYPNEEDDSTIVFNNNALKSFYLQNSMNWTPFEIDPLRNTVILKFESWEYQKSERAREFTLPIRNYAIMTETGSDYDWNSYIDLGYFEKIYRQYCNTLKLEDRKKAIESLNKYREIWLNVDNLDNVEEVQDKIKELGYSSESLIQYFRPTLEASKTLQLLFLFLGGVSMFVSAISIANTMIMSIYERTKEIGIMKVLGCVVKDIRLLFLFEAGMIGLFGGAIGVGFSYLASYFINKYGQSIFGALMTGGISMGGMEMGATYSIIPIYLPLLGLGISIVVGLLSGYFPARRATKISAIEAMRTEN